MMFHHVTNTILITLQWDIVSGESLHSTRSSRSASVTILLEPSMILDENMRNLNAYSDFSFSLSKSNSIPSNQIKSNQKNRQNKCEQNTS